MIMTFPPECGAVKDGEREAFPPSGERVGLGAMTQKGTKEE